MFEEWVIHLNSRSQVGVRFPRKDNADDDTHFSVLFFKPTNNEISFQLGFRVDYSIMVRRTDFSPFIQQG